MSKKIKIAIVIPGGIGTGYGNIGVPVLERIIRLLSKDFHVTVFSLFKVNDDYVADGFELVSIHSRNFIEKTIRFFFTFRKYHRARRFAIVHGFWALPSGFLAVAAGKLFGLKSVVSVLGADSVSVPEINYGELRRWFSRRLILWTLKHANEAIALTKYQVDNLRSYGMLRQMKIIPWGVDNALFSLKKKPLRSESVTQFLHIGNLTPVKDQSTLLRAFEIICRSRPAHLTIIGAGPLKSMLKDQVVSLGLRESVTMIDFVPYDHLPAYYQASDVLLHTSLSEGQSEVVTEAMSCGVVVCGTAVGLLYDLPGCCVTVPRKDYSRLGNDVLTLLSDTTRIDEIRREAYNWATIHSIRWTVKMIEEIYAYLGGTD